MKTTDKCHECDKCGDPNIYKEWDNIKLCRICFEDLLADAKALTELGQEDQE